MARAVASRVVRYRVEHGLSQAELGFPQFIGTTNTTGSSQYFAREDHIHPRNRAKGLIRGRS